MSLPTYHLFDAFGIELEYMIVDKKTLEVKPLADNLLKYALGAIGNDFENGVITWSNELVLHVIEIKSTRPESDLQTLDKAFVRNVAHINSILNEKGAMLMPTAAHPFMNPLSDTRLWPHDNNEVYALYDKIFNSKGHGWANLQSTHLNLPFQGDEEFAKLHAAVRLILPLLPALCASSPILDSQPTGLLDTRLHYYKNNQAKIPVITGNIIPENVYSQAEYNQVIYEPIANEVVPYDPNEILDPVWVNSRGAIARFDRGSIEIRVMDIQECPAVDLAIINTVVETLQWLVAEKTISLKEQMKMGTAELAALFDKTTVTGLATNVDDAAYLAAFGLQGSATVSDIWKNILAHTPAISAYQKINRELVNTILDQGSLSERILRALQNDYSNEKIKSVYKQLSVCLAEDKLFIT